MRPSLPVEGISLILGNDLAGEKVMVDPRVGGERNKEKAETALMRNESRNVKGNIPEKQEGESRSVISRQNLIEEQSNDKQLLDFFKKSLITPRSRKGKCWLYNQGKYFALLLLLKEKWLDEDPEKISV